MVYVIIVNWNGWRDTVACLVSLLRAEHNGLSVVVCDNLSSDGSLAELQAWADYHLERKPFIGELPPHAKFATFWTAPTPSLTKGSGKLELTLIANDANLGFAGGNNIGICLAISDPKCDYIFLLNNDTEVEPDAILALTSKMQLYPDIVQCGPTLVYHDNRQIVQGVGGKYNKFAARAYPILGDTNIADLPAETEIEPMLNYVIGAAIFARSALFKRVGGLCDDYFLYYEEMDLSQQLLPFEKIGWAKNAVVAHKVGGSTGSGRIKTRGSDLSIYYNFRSKVRFYFKYLKAYLPFLLANIIKTFLAFLVKRDFKAASMIWLAVVDFTFRDKLFRRDFP